MRSFLLKEKTPITKWGSLPANTYFEGDTPEGYQKAVSPGIGYIVLDIDMHGNINGFKNIPKNIDLELPHHFGYPTKNNGRHVWMKYSGNKTLLNKTSGLGIDLRVANKGYVVWYPKEDVRECIYKMKKTSKEMNLWLEELFS